MAGMISGVINGRCNAHNNGSIGTFRKWKKRIQIDILPYMLLSNFPVLVDETVLPGSIWDLAVSGGGDLRACSDSQGINRLYLEVVRFDNIAKKAQIWIKSNTSNIVNIPIYLFYGRAGEVQPAAGDPGGRFGVWDGDYLAVYHMADTITEIFDSTSNLKNGGINGTLPNRLDGKCGYCQYFNGSLDYSNLPNFGSFAQTTIECWANQSTQGDDRALISNKIWMPGYVHHKIHNNDLYAALNPGPFLIKSNAIAVNTWYQIIYSTHKNVIMNLWKNGLIVDTSASITLDNILNTIEIGHETDDYTPGNRFFSGKIDEIRISKISRSNDWLQAGYKNQNLVIDYLLLKNYVTP